MSENGKITRLPINHITITNHFWKNYMELVRKNVIPYQWEALNDRVKGAEPSHCINNFLVAAGKKEGKFEGFVFQDSDVYKWLEAVAYSLMWHPDKELEKTADETIDIIAAAQQEDGYLDTYYIINGLDKRFTNLRDNHELYCMGHMLEAAIAYFEATGKKKFLEAATAYADCAENEFGLEVGKKRGYPGHEIAEMALIKLYGITKDPRHLKLARYFIEERGKSPLYFQFEEEKNQSRCNWIEGPLKYQYYQAGKPVREQTEAEGHAVRAVYLYSGMADVARETKDESLIRACEELWKDMTGRKMYITGAIGSSEYGESFSFAYDLPNDTIYGETCASIGLIFFARRMFELTKDRKYIDVMEKALYNGVISGMSLDGKSFFYVNPLEVLPEACEKDWNKRHVKAERQKWFGCACCPPNVARLLSSVANYAFETDEDTLYLNLYIGGKIQTIIGGKEVDADIETDYPWDGTIKVHINKAVKGTLTYGVRIPAWCKDYSILVNGEKATEALDKGYLYLNREWKAGDTITIDLSMPVEMAVANPKVRENVGKVAVTRGPLVYCLEEADNGKGLSQYYIKKSTDFKAIYEKDFLGGIVTITADGIKLSDSNWSEDTLYSCCTEPFFEKRTLKLIPYYAWANRGAGEMLVWIHI